MEKMAKKNERAGQFLVSTDPRELVGIRRSSGKLTTLYYRMDACLLPDIRQVFPRLAAVVGLDRGTAGPLRPFFLAVQAQDQRALTYVSEAVSTMLLLRKAGAPAVANRG
jgi:hypothetical protein